MINSGVFIIYARIPYAKNITSIVIDRCKHLANLRRNAKTFYREIDIFKRDVVVVCFNFMSSNIWDQIRVSIHRLLVVLLVNTFKQIKVVDFLLIRKMLELVSGFCEWAVSLKCNKTFLNGLFKILEKIENAIPKIPSCFKILFGHLKNLQMHMQNMN